MSSVNTKIRISLIFLSYSCVSLVFLGVSAQGYSAEEVGSCRITRQNGFETLAPNPKLLSAGIDEEDYQSSFGTIIDKTCFGLSDFATDRIFTRAEIIAMSEKTLQYIFTQAQRCDSYYQFTEISDAINVLKHARLRCENFPNGIAQNHSIDRIPVDAKEIDRRHTGEFQFRMLPKAFARPEYTEELAHVLFHEALHSTSSNQRGDHNDAWKYPVNGCQGSRYQDRIYYLASVCFTALQHGGAFYTAFDRRDVKDMNLLLSSSCREVCQAAMSDADQGLLDQMSKIEDSAPLIARKVSADEAKQFCDRQAAAYQIYANIRALSLLTNIMANREPENDDPDAAYRAPTADRDLRRVYSYVNYRNYVIDHSILPASLSSESVLNKGLQQLAKFRDELTPMMNQVCSPEAKVTPERAQFCKDVGLPALDLMGKILNAPPEVQKTLMLFWVPK